MLPLRSLIQWNINDNFFISNILARTYPFFSKHERNKIHTRRLTTKFFSPNERSWSNLMALKPVSGSIYSQKPKAKEKVSPFYKKSNTCKWRLQSACISHTYTTFPTLKFAICTLNTFPVDNNTAFLTNANYSKFITAITSFYKNILKALSNLDRNGGDYLYI